MVIFGLRTILAALALLTLVGVARAEIVLTDITGRTVRLAAPAKRILLGTSLLYPGLSLLRKNAADLVVGVGSTPGGGDFGADFEAVRDLVQKPRVGSLWQRTFSIEKALDLKPDLLIVGAPIGQQAIAVIEDTFAKVGIPILYVDFNADPARNTAASIEIIGKAIGAEDEAAEFVDFFRRHVSRITERLKATRPASPKLLMTAYVPGATCCFTTASGGMTAYFDDLGVRNIAKDVASGGVVQLSLEHVIESNPDVYVVAGPNPPFGQPPNRERARAVLDSLRSQPGFRDLSAMRARRVHAIDFSLPASAFNVLALEVLAKWIHPASFRDVDPQATLDEINRRFLATPLEGPFWVSLDPAADWSSSERP